MNLKKSTPSIVFSSLLALYLSIGVVYTSMLTFPYGRYFPAITVLLVTALIGCVGGYILKNKIPYAYSVALATAFYAAALADIVVWLRSIHVVLVIGVLVALSIGLVALFKKFFALKQLSLLQKILIVSSVWVVLFFACRFVSLYLMRVFM